MEIEKNSVFLLTCSEADGNKKAFGTGFAFSYMEEEKKLFILTCAHVVEILKCKVKIDKYEAVVEAIGSSETIDLALLSIPWTSSPPPILNQLVQGMTGMKCQLCGFYSADPKSLLHVVRNIKGNIGQSIGLGADRVEAWDIHADTEGDELSKLNFGYSGSPLCDDNGRLIGVISHKVGNGERGFVIAISNLRKILPDNNEHLACLFPCFTKYDVVNCECLSVPSISEKFFLFLSNAELFTNAHSEKKSVVIDDIFVYPELSKYNDCREYEGKESSRGLIEKIDKYQKIIISGESQSGKTTLAKKIFLKLHEAYYIPVYISAESIKHAYHGKIENKIKEAFKEQYCTEIIIDREKERIVIIIDDFHFADAARKERHIQYLSEYRQVIIVDDIFHLNLKNDSILESFVFFRIEEFTPSLRNELIEKWTNISDGEQICKKQNLIYQKIDDSTELVNTTLGKMFGNGIMPAYPFFILSIITTYEAFSTPLNQEITSQGYCYQAFVYIFLRKNNVKNDEIDTYINFLTELSFFFYSNKKVEASEEELGTFMESYLLKYNLPIDTDVLIKKLLMSHIIELDGLGFYSFSYQYLYYFFVAKYISDNMRKEKDIIFDIIKNLHKKENAYIAIFISHHSRDDYFLDEILLNAYYLFDNYKQATLAKKELSFFDKQEKLIVKAALPIGKSNPEKERSKRLKCHDVIEENNITEEEEGYDDIDDDYITDLRRSIKTVEVIGCIIKNRAGSLEKTRIEEFIKESMKIHLRILSSFFDIIKHEDGQKEIVDFISNSIRKNTEERVRRGQHKKLPSIEELEEISKRVFWNLNFFTILCILRKIIYSLGSKKLIKIIEDVCDKEGTPASFLIKHGILMWYCKSMQVDTICKEIEKDDFSYISIQILKRMVVDYCSLHQVNRKERGRITNKLKIPSEKLLKLTART